MEQSLTITRSSHLLGEQITIFVGTDKARFTIAKDLLVSSFFERALTGPFKEAGSGILELPEEDPPAFELFINYLSFDSVPDIVSLGQHMHVTFQQMEHTGMLEHEKPWHKLLQMTNKFLLDDLRFPTLVCIRDYHHATKTVCHRLLLIEDFEAWANFAANSAGEYLETHAVEELRFIKRANAEQYGFFIVRMLEHLPGGVMAALPKRKHVDFLGRGRFLRTDYRNGFGIEAHKPRPVQQPTWIRGKISRSLGRAKSTNSPVPDGCP